MNTLGIITYDTRHLKPEQDAQINAGDMVSMVPTPVFLYDTLETLARRHYENEIQILARLEKYLEHPRPLCGHCPRRKSPPHENGAEAGAAGALHAL